MQSQWPLWQRMLFRFFFIYLTLSITPWTWVDRVPGAGIITEFYHSGMDWLVRKANAWFFHVKDELVPVGGSGDTSWGWAQLWLILSLAFIGMLVWSVLDRRRKEYRKLNYWLCLFTRYYLALVLFSYGIIKLFGLQMGFPTPSQLATPLGDFLPMRFSWLFIGYSNPYQFFSGLMEVVAGLLLLYRRTVTLGVMVATGVFINVAVLNLSYDIPVKIYSLQMVLACFFLLANEMERILCFFFYNKPASSCTIYDYTYPKKWMRVTRVILKIAFIIIAVGMVIYESITWKKEMENQYTGMAFKAGMYDVTTYVVNGDTIPALMSDTLRWQNMIFDNARSGSIATRENAFRKLYGRSYFSYKADTVKRTFDILTRRTDSIPFAALQYRFTDDQTILFWGKRQNDSFTFVLKRNPHNFQLAEKQFHWLSEANR
ncbi:MAG TPA: hypothetical protein VGD17_00310 [Chitinophagaceae bacterium]